MKNDSNFKFNRLKNRYHIILYNFFWNCFYRIKHNSCNHSEIHKCDNDVVIYFK